MFFTQFYHDNPIASWHLHFADLAFASNILIKTRWGDEISKAYSYAWYYTEWFIWRQCTAAVEWLG